ncbi:hypothetical protein [Planomicrobium sp. Y74]|uniref:hypothetical protein n=1 Tax=Planomicrobium sp. Y74 TaxID=2478977 RepID=UPI000EF4A2C5|nr:hypothetical protein [Planomicrobium sp. Y74]RLQ92113.1 hypothetical protein D9754_04835 [Planomicrobium sp. Y74]
MVCILVNFKNYRSRKDKRVKTSDNHIDKIVSIDTLVLRVKLTDEQKEFLYDRFYYDFHRSKYYRYSLYFEDMGFTLQLSPKKNELHKYFNATLTLHRKFFQRDYIPHSIIDILNFIDWSIVRLDIAFDYNNSKQDSLLFKHHGNLKDASYENETYYIGNHKSQKKSHTLVNYDRNLKEIKRNTGIDHDYSNRLETRFKFNMAAMKLNNMNHDLIYTQLNRYLFIADISSVNTDGYRKNRIRKLQHNYKQIKQFDTKEAKEIRRLINAQREPLVDIYKSKKSSLFDFMNYKESYINESIVNDDLSCSIGATKHG